MRVLFLLISIVFLSSCGKNKETNTPSSSKAVEEVNSINKELQIVNLPVDGKAHLPRLNSAGGKLFMSWVEEKEDLTVLKHSIYDKEKWDEPRVTVWGSDWFVNWADFPALGVNEEGYVLTNILQKSAKGTYDYDIKLQLSQGDKLIKDDFLLNTDGIPAEHGFVSFAAYKDGFYASWLDGRNTKNEDASLNMMTLRNAFIDSIGNISQETEIDARVCDCCNTATAITENGPVVVYRDRSDVPEVRDMAIVRKVNGKWTAPVAIGNDNWLLNGCPVNGPAIDAIKNEVVVSWFTAEGDTPRVMTAFSSDGGATFGKSIRVDSGNAIGRVGAQLLDNGNAIVSWLEPQGDKTVLQVVTMYKEGSLGNVTTVTTTSAERQSGFPQLEVIDDTVYVAWTDIDGENSSIKMVEFDIE